ncbi:hypothetical protein QZH41_000404 [Actinostola sp. cb2023]|nr:hypothetical protein QZH41_000404 [Actinostola sp. cb2023]
MATQLGIDDTVVVMDQSIYAKALEAEWKQQEEFNSIVLRMGSFHVACVFLAVIGKRFGDDGLRYILHESRIIGSAWFNEWSAGRSIITEPYARIRLKKAITLETGPTPRIINLETVNMAITMVETLEILKGISEVVEVNIVLERISFAEKMTESRICFSTYGYDQSILRDILKSPVLLEILSSCEITVEQGQNSEGNNL